MGELGAESTLRDISALSLKDGGKSTRMTLQDKLVGITREALSGDDSSGHKEEERGRIVNVKFPFLVTMEREKRRRNACKAERKGGIPGHAHPSFLSGGFDVDADSGSGGEGDEHFGG